MILEKGLRIFLNDVFNSFSGPVATGPPKLTQPQQKEIITSVTSGQKTGADMARLFQVLPSTIVRLIAKNRLNNQT